MPKSATTVIPHSSRSRGNSKAARDSYQRRVRRHLAQQEPPTGPVASLPVLEPAPSDPLRSWIFSQPNPISPSDLRRHQPDLSWNAACSALESLEALRLLGSSLHYGVRRWHHSLPINEDRVLMLRRPQWP